MASLDTLLNTLRAKAPEVRLDQLEPLVWGRIAAARAPLDIGAGLGWRAGVAAMMLTIGVLVGGTTAASAAQEPSPFAVHSAYAPSTLLEGRH